MLRTVLSKSLRPGLITHGRLHLTKEREYMKISDSADTIRARTSSGLISPQTRNQTPTTSSRGIKSARSTWKWRDSSPAGEPATIHRSMRYIPDTATPSTRYSMEYATKHPVHDKATEWTFHNDVRIRIANIDIAISLVIHSPRTAQLRREEEEMGLTSYDEILEDD